MATLVGVVGFAVAAATFVAPGVASATTPVGLWLNPNTGTIGTTSAPEIVTDGTCPVNNTLSAQNVKVTVKGGSGSGAITAINGKNYVGVTNVGILTTGGPGSVNGGYIIPAIAATWADWFTNYAGLGAGPMLGTYTISAICAYADGSSVTLSGSMSVDANGNFTSLPVGQQATPIHNTTAPSVTGTPSVGSTLTANPGVWDQAGATYAYQWFSGTTAISGATNKTYVPVAGDVGNQLTVQVTASLAGFSDGVATSAPVTVVAQLGTINNTALPALTGVPTVGSTLSVSDGTWDPTGLQVTYQWNSDNNPIMGATNNTYVVTSADATHTITATVTVNKTGYAQAQATSNSVIIEGQNSFNATKAPVIVGNVAVGSTLGVIGPMWSTTGVSDTYTWLRNGSPIAGATAAKYKLVAADKGKIIDVRVTGTKSGFSTAVATSYALLWNYKAPAVSGKAKVGQTLKASPGIWYVGGLSVKYQWTRNGAAIKGATKTTYKLAKTDKGKKVAVTITVAHAGFRTQSLSSAALKVS